MEKNPDSLMWKIAGSLDKVNGLTSFDAMRKGDEEAQKVVDEYLHSVATGLVDILNIMQPEVLCIGGGISKEGDYLLKPVKAFAEKEMYARFNKTKTDIRIAKLGNDAGIIGAALLGV
jgi:glucokinase